MGYVNLIRKVVGGAQADWTRPADWITIPSIGASDQVYYLLAAIFDDGSNLVAFKCAGNYTVDWGDGSATENFAANAQAEHTYSYAACSDLSLQGYKQALIKVIPQVGQNLTLLNIGVAHSSFANLSTSLFVDIVIHSQYFNTWTNYLNTGFNSRILQRLDIRKAAATINTSMPLRGSYSLRVVNLVNTKFSELTYSFQNCYSLKSAQLSTASAISNLSYMYNNCVTLLSVVKNIASVTNITLMFDGCSSLKVINLTNCGSLTTTTDAFRNLYSLSTLILSGIKVSFSATNAKLSASAIDALGNSVADMTGFTAPTATLTGNWGVAGMTLSIWTNKNWNVITA